MLTAKAGDLVHVEPGEAHYLRNASDAPAAVFCLAPFQEKVTKSISIHGVGGRLLSGARRAAWALT